MCLPAVSTGVYRGVYRGSAFYQATRSRGGEHWMKLRIRFRVKGEWLHFAMISRVGICSPDIGLFSTGSQLWFIAEMRVSIWPTESSRSRTKLWPTIPVAMSTRLLMMFIDIIITTGNCRAVFELNRVKCNERHTSGVAGMFICTTLIWAPHKYKFLTSLSKSFTF